jgi:uncharacterized membrane protein
MRTWKSWLAYFLVFALVQPSTMYLLLRVWHWRFFLSAVLAAALSVFLAYSAGRFVDRRPKA